MEITVNKHYELTFKKVYNEIVFQTDDGEEMVLCMRDSGFEFVYQGQHYSAKEGTIEKVIKK